MKLTYSVTFLDYWHLGSGLSNGAKLDSSVIKDHDGLVYIPGKTLKGLTREMAELLQEDGFITRCFGKGGGRMGTCFFQNATIDHHTRQRIVENRLQEHLYTEIASTQISDAGIAVDNSLREIEVVIPITLYGEIWNVPNDCVDLLEQSLKMIKRMGLHRHRGLGRCTINILQKDAS
jgi:hypothetical protein